MYGDFLDYFENTASSSKTAAASFGQLLEKLG